MDDPLRNRIPGRMSNEELLVRIDWAAADVLSSTGPRRAEPDRVAAGDNSAIIDELLDRLEQTLQIGESHRWLLRPNEWMNGARPVDLVSRGQVDEVIAVLETFRLAA